MKQIELELKERLIIFEHDTIKEMEIEESLHRALPDVETKLICKGSELTEDIAKEYAIEFKFGEYKLHNKPWYISCKSALESFLSAIEAQGYYWGENPVQFDDKETCFNKRYDMRLNWEKAQSRTFNPDKTLISKILL